MTRPEWGAVAVTEDLEAEARTLGELATDYETEARGWTHPQARMLLTSQALTIREQAQAAVLASQLDDYWQQLDALQRALAQRQVAQLTLRAWFDKGELWNTHRMRPVPASLRGAL